MQKRMRKISWTASESSKAGKKAAQTWNDLVFDEKTGEVKSNVAEVVTEATKDSLTWNNLKLVVHDADLDSNAKDVIGEAAIANGWWTVWLGPIKSNTTRRIFDNNVQSIRRLGKWAEMSFDEKKHSFTLILQKSWQKQCLIWGCGSNFNPRLKI